MGNHDEKPSYPSNNAAPNNTGTEPLSKARFTGDGMLQFAGAIIAAVVGALIAGGFLLTQRSNQPTVSQVFIDAETSTHIKTAAPSPGQLPRDVLPGSKSPVAPASTPVQDESKSPVDVPSEVQVRVSGNILTGDAERLRAAVLEGLMNNVNGKRAQMISIQCSTRDGELLLGNVPVAVISATWTFGAVNQQSYAGAIRALEVFGTSISEARTAAADSAGVLIAKRILTQIQESQR